MWVLLNSASALAYGGWWAELLTFNSLSWSCGSSGPTVSGSLCLLDFVSLLEARIIWEEETPVKKMSHQSPHSSIFFTKDRCGKAQPLLVVPPLGSLSGWYKRAAEVENRPGKSFPPWPLFRSCPNFPSQCTVN